MTYQTLLTCHVTDTRSDPEWTVLRRSCSFASSSASQSGGGGDQGQSEVQQIYIRCSAYAPAPCHCTWESNARWLTCFSPCHVGVWDGASGASMGGPGTSVEVQDGVPGTGMEVRDGAPGTSVEVGMGFLAPVWSPGTGMGV